jgi:hypothetical protein
MMVDDPALDDFFALEMNDDDKVFLEIWWGKRVQEYREDDDLEFDKCFTTACEKTIADFQSTFRLRPFDERLVQIVDRWSFNYEHYKTVEIHGRWVIRYDWHGMRSRCNVFSLWIFADANDRAGLEEGPANTIMHVGEHYDTRIMDDIVCGVEDDWMFDLPDPTRGTNYVIEEHVLLKI